MAGVLTCAGFTTSGAGVAATPVIQLAATTSGIFSQGLGDVSLTSVASDGTSPYVFLSAASFGGTGNNNGGEVDIFSPQDGAVAEFQINGAGPDSSTAGAIPNAMIFAGLKTGLACCAAEVHVSNPVRFFKDNTVGGEIWNIDAAQHWIGVATSGTIPAVTNTSANSCGTTAATIVGTDQSGKITVGATSGTSCTLTFKIAWTQPPSCITVDETTATAVKTITTTTTAIITGTFTAADKLAYLCMGYRT